MNKIRWLMVAGCLLPVSSLRGVLIAFDSFENVSGTTVAADGTLGDANTNGFLNAWKFTAGSGWNLILPANIPDMTIDEFRMGTELGDVVPRMKQLDSAKYVFKTTHQYRNRPVCRVYVHSGREVMRNMRRIKSFTTKQPVVAQKQLSQPFFMIRLA